MGSFITDGSAVLPSVKTDERAATVPPASDEWAAADANALREAALDLRTAVLGVQPGFVDPNVAMVTATGTTASRALQDRFKTVYNVKDFGAMGDNIADDRAAISAAILAASTGGGGTVFFPPGDYRMLPSSFSYLYMYNNVRLEGAGPVGQSTGTRLRPVGSYPLFKPSGSNGRFVVSNLQIDCLTQTNTGSAADDTAFLINSGGSSVYDLVIENTYIRLASGTTRSAVYLAANANAGRVTLNNVLIGGATGNVALNFWVQNSASSPLTVSMVNVRTMSGMNPAVAALFDGTIDATLVGCDLYGTDAAVRVTSTVSGAKTTIVGGRLSNDGSGGYGVVDLANSVNNVTIVGTDIQPTSSGQGLTARGTTSRGAISLVGVARVADSGFFSHFADQNYAAFKSDVPLVASMHEVKQTFTKTLASSGATTNLWDVLYLTSGWVRVKIWGGTSSATTVMSELVFVAGGSGSSYGNTQTNFLTSTNVSLALTGSLIANGVRISVTPTYSGGTTTQTFYGTIEIEGYAATNFALYAL